MNLKQLPYFVAIAETGSLSAAARKIGVSQPAISGYLQDLEKELGTPLFVRSRRRMLPTEAGAIYLDMARQILSLQARTAATIQACHNRQKQVIRIGFSPHRGAQALAAIYQPFIKRFPAIELEPVEGYMRNEFEMLRASQLDLAFATIVRPFSDPALHILPLQEEEVVLALPAFHRLAHLASRDLARAPQIGLAEFQDTPFVLMTPDSTMGQISQQLFDRSGFDPVIAFRSGNIVMIRDMIRFGAGGGLLPAYYAPPLEEVVYFRLRQPGYMTFCVACNQSHLLSEAERYLLYLKVCLWDSKNTNLLSRFLWPEEMQAIIREFESENTFPRLKKEGGPP